MNSSSVLLLVKVAFAIFIYSICVMMAFQFWIIDYMSSNASNGLIAGDPQLYHGLAVEMAASITREGWGSWVLRPAGHGPAGVLSILYYFIGPYPLLAVFINGICHAIASVFLIVILCRVIPIKYALFASLYFILSPFEMHWLSQVNKESFVILGFFIFIYGVVCFVESKKYPSLISIIWMLLGAGFISINRPYVVQIIFIASILFGFLLLLISFWKSHLRNKGFSILILPVFFIPLMFGAASDQTISSTSFLNAEEPMLTDNNSDMLTDNNSDMLTDNNSDMLTDNNSDMLTDNNSDNCIRSTSGEIILSDKLIRKYSSWTKSDILPKAVDEKLFALSYSRLPFEFLKCSPNATVRAFVLTDEAEFHSASDMIFYMPRALQVALLAPFPTDWPMFSNIDDRSVFRLMVSAEKMLAYFAYIFLLFGLYKARSLKYYMPVYYILFLMTVYGVATPHIGVMYRYNYSFFMLLISLGVAFIIRYWIENYNKITFTDNNDEF